MPSERARPPHLGWMLFLLACLTAYGLGACNARKAADHPSASRSFTP